MMKPFRCFCWVLPLVFLAQSRAAELQTWTDVQNRQIQAESLGRQGRTIYLRTADGRVHAVPIDRLSPADAERALQQPEQQPAAAATGPALPPLRPEQSAERIDRLLEAHLAARKVSPNPPMTDEQFVRRAYLDIVGRIPKLAEAREFLDDKARDKRTVLMDRLLASPGHHSHLFNFYANLLRLKTRAGEYVSGATYNRWVRESIAANKPYDQMVREMLTASGSSRGNPATGYLLRDAGMPLDNLSITVQCFLGIDLSCAQCHDHPFADWTQKEFYQLAAFMGRTRTTPNYHIIRAEAEVAGRPFVDRKKLIDSVFEHRAYDGVMHAALHRFMQAAEHRVADDPKLVLTLPHDYKYKDGKPGDPVEPRVIYGPTPDLTRFDSPRAAFAHWLTADDNPRFAITLANRLWARAFGRGLLEPLQDLGDFSTADVPGLLEVLGEEMRRVRYDVRAFEAILYRTRAWQRQASTTSPAMGGAYDFPGPLLRRLSAAQIWDSILTLVLDDPDYYQAKRDYTEWEQIHDLDRPAVTGKELLQRFEQLTALQQRDGSVFGWPKDDPSQRRPDQPLWFDKRIEAWRLYGEVLIRASDLQQPAPPQHLLSLLGQSDRELSNGDTTVGSVPIVLAMANGSGSQVITRTGSRILDALEQFQADGPKVDTLFLSILSRLPTADERSIAYKAIRRDGKPGFENVVWSLLNTREFLFIQ